MVWAHIAASASEGLTIPSSVKFEAGQKTASLTIGVGEMEEDKKYSFDLAIDEAYADHYSSQFKGTSHFSGYALQASWKTYVKDADMTWTINGNQQKWTVDIERLGSTNRYLIGYHKGHLAVFQLAACGWCYPVCIRIV